MKLPSLIQKMHRISVNESRRDLIWYLTKEVEECLLKVWFKEVEDPLYELYDSPVFAIIDDADHPYIAILGSRETEWAIGLTHNGKIQITQYKD